MKLEDETWIKYLKRLINLFYCASVVKNITLNEKEWKVELYGGNNPAWIKPHLEELIDEITILRNQVNLKAPEKIIVV